MKVQNEFSRKAEGYNSFRVIQQRVIEEVLRRMPDEPESILDIGCGSGHLYNAISWPLKRFTGIDFAQSMIDLHPKSENVELLLRDFNHMDCFKGLELDAFDRIISTSALQWADEPDKTFRNISAFKAPVSFALFTSGTFETLSKTASIPSLIRSADELTDIAKKYFTAEYEVLKYTLDFPSVREMFQYIKKSGVSGARNILKYSQMKALMRDYPLGYLEFEVLMVREIA